MCVAVHVFELQAQTETKKIVDVTLVTLYLRTAKINRQKSCNTRRKSMAIMCIRNNESHVIY